MLAASFSGASALAPKVERGAQLVAASREQSADDVVVSKVAGEAGAEPLFQGSGFAEVRLLHFGRYDTIPPSGGHVGGEAGRREEPPHQVESLRRVLVGQELPHLAHMGHHAGEVEVGAADELAIGRQGGRLDTCPGPPSGEHLFDAVAHGDRVGRHR